MSDIRNAGTSGKARRRRIIKVAPMTRAVRSALAVSALTLAIGFGSGNASAANHAAATSAHALRIERPAIDFAPVFDLTVAQGLVPGGINPQVAALIDQHYVGDVNILNNAPIIESGVGNVTAISGYSDTGNVSIVNTTLGALSVQAYYGNAIGIYGYALDGNVAITNTGSIVADSTYGLADGIFASGNDVTVVNTGDITATGYSWAAGIEAQAGDVTAVTNTGNIYASASGNYGLGYGIYATGDGSVGVTNDGGITVRGYYASGIHAQSGGDVTVTNYANGAIDAGSTTGSALAWGIDASSNGEGSQVLVDNAADIQAAAVYGATGISAVASGLGGSAQVNNSGDITVTQNASINSYGAYGILVSGDASAVIDNSGDITVSSRGPAFGMVALTTTGSASASNSGDVVVTSTRNSTSVSAIGILAAGGYGTASVDNSGSVTATGVRVASGVDISAYGDVSVDNTGDISAIANAASGLSGRANGIKAISGTGDITIDNVGDVYARGRTLALSVYALAYGGDITVNNDVDGYIGFFSAAGRGWGVWTYAADGDVTIDNQGYIGGLSASSAYGVLAQAPQGEVSVDNGGVIDVTSAAGTARGVLAVTSTGTASITNTGDISATSGIPGFTGTSAYGVIASGAYADVSNSGNITAQGNTVAAGVVAQSAYGANVSSTGGNIYAIANGTAIGISASASYGEATVDNAGNVVAVAYQGNATGIVANGYYGASVQNSGAVAVGGLNNATAISAISDAGDVVLENDGPVQVQAVYGNGIGLYAYSTYGNASVGNTGDISVESVYGLADGIFASGADVDVTNAGSLEVNGSTWAAGIEAQGTGITTVQNDGDIFAYADGPGGTAFGIYATGDAGITIGNTANVEAQGYDATGIEARSNGDIAIDTTGNITAGYIYSGNYYSAVATGINAMTGGIDAQVTVTNGGDIAALGYYGATGISAVSSGQGGTASVDNSGNITVAQGNKYGYGANGIFVSADDDATITNTGSITVNSEGAAAGAVALSFAGDASVVNAGDVMVDSQAVGYYSAYGIVSFSANGTASADNSGNIGLSTKYIGAAMDVSGLEGATATNTGDIAVDAWRGYGVRAQSGNGDVAVDNSGSISATYTGGYFSGTAFGILATSTNGGVGVNNSGTIDTSASGQSAGVFAVSTYGDVSVDNSGSISAYSGSNVAVGVLARANGGTASIDNSGEVAASANSGAAYALIAQGGDAVVNNSGYVSAEGYDVAIGIAAVGYYSASVDSAGGSIDAFSAYDAQGIFANSFYGDAAVTNTSGISAMGIYGSGVGIAAQTVLGDASVTNSGEISALSVAGEATGISANTVLGDATIDNAGDITAASMNGSGNAIGLYAYSEYGNAIVHNTGAITAYSHDGLADGIFASGYAVDVANEGGIEASGYTWAAGIEAQGTAYAHVTNSGDIQSNAMPFVQVSDYYGYTLGGTNGGQAFGIYATGGTYGVRVDNSGALSVDGGYVTGIEVQSGGNAVVVNSGDIAAGSGLSSYYNEYNGNTYYYGTQVAAGINASSNAEGATVVVQNSGDITADAIFGANGISVVSSGIGGEAVAYNSGDIAVSQANKYGYGAYGVFASGDGMTGIQNDGSVTVESEGLATGLAALSFAGDAVVVNNGDIAVSNTAMLYYGATGITAFSGNGDATIANYGSVGVISQYQATAADARALGDVTVVNGGTLNADGMKYAFGVYASAGTGNVMVDNRAGGEIGFYSYVGRGFGVLGVSSQGDVTVTNEGSIEGYAYGQSAGIFAVALQGDTGVGNSGSIDVTTGGNVAVGVFARADYGTATVVNSGSIDATSGNAYYAGYAAYGVLARGAYAQASNSGSISATGHYAATGLAARSDYGTVVSTTSTSDITATSDYVAIGIEGRSEYGDVTVANGGAIQATGMYGGAVGIQAYSGEGDSAAGNTGHIVVTSDYGIGIGLSSYAYMGDAVASNGGQIEANGSNGAYGISVQSGYGSATASNSGSITAASAYESVGVIAEAYGNITVNNTAAGHIEATGGYVAYGVLTSSYEGDVVVNNAGSIHASGAYFNAGVVFDSAYGDNTLNNLAGGVISADGADGYAYAVLGNYGTDTIHNSGRILGAIDLGGGDDVFDNKSGGVWDVGSTTYTDFGSGNDTLTNAAGGKVLLNGGQIAFSAGDDTVNNAGLIRMTDSVITMGGMVPLLMPLAAEVNAFNNSGTLQVVGSNAIDTAGGIFTNTGVVDFANGLTTDQLAIGGDLAGTGAMNIDVNLASSASDMLVVDGDVAGNAVQTVNVQFTGIPTTDTVDIDFANITGTSVAGNFVAGQFIGYNANANFLTFGLAVNSAINTANTADDVFSITLDVAGLSDSGSLVASSASGVASFMTSQVGTFRQRLGVNPYGDAGKVMSAFVRLYSDQGDVSPKHTSAFGAGGNFDYDQATWGREVGINANLYSNLHAGLVLGNADSRQRLTNGGSGQSRMDGMTVGGYLTWYVPNGFYVDFTARQMAADIHTTTSAGTMSSRAHVNAVSLEGGYEWSMGGFNLVPQAQYTRTHVEDIRTFTGDMADMTAHGGTYERGRVGVELNKTYLSGDLRWTPYASINAVHDFSGTSTYTVANVFNGSTTVKGTSAMAELGVGVQKGGLGFTLSANWNDGGAFKSFVGAQANVRYSW
ncbi:hypothetical protein [Thermomonas sp.]|uniref:hypothetical protein n=1 Tax=Thermomonas sp. TaxID=1971895 RepID=UPI0035ADDCC6